MASENQTAAPAALPLVRIADGHGCHEKTQVRHKRRKKSAIKFFLGFQSNDIDVVVIPGMLPAVSSSTATSDAEELDEGKGISQQRKQGNFAFFPFLKAVFFKTSLVKKFQQKKIARSDENPTDEFSITSRCTQEWTSDQEDAPRRIKKTTTSGGNSFFTYIKEEEEVEFPTMKPPLLDNEEKRQDQGINKGRRRLPRFLKTILLNTSLIKKMQEKKLAKKAVSNESATSSTGASPGEEVIDHHKPEKLTKTPSSLTNSSVFTSSSILTSSASSSLSAGSRSTSHSRSFSERIKSFGSTSSSSNIKANNFKGMSDNIRSNSNSSLKIGSRYLFGSNKVLLEAINSNGLKEEHHAHFDCNVTSDNEKSPKLEDCCRSGGSASGLCFLLMSLLGLILFGKLWAILCTSMWLVCVPLWSFGEITVVDKKNITIGRESLTKKTARCQSINSKSVKY